ncbi:MAG: putative colanic acid biosynthesis acetyltransferase [Burkholderiales bacterium]|nr:MAG: putative colanic acid biosynthesis acetyltransferase [Burkholderiales bacterium]
MILQGVDSRTGPSFSIGNRLARGLWGVVWLLLFRTSPRPFHAWRVALLRLFGAQIGRHFHIHSSCRVWAPWQFKAGDHVGVGEGVNFYNMGPMEIGSNAVISQGAHLCGGTHDYTVANFQLRAMPITVGERAWVCTEAFIGPGVQVPEGCVIGARAVLTKTPEDGDWSVYAGNPAKFIKPRILRG